MKKQEVGKTQFCYNHLYYDHLTVVPNGVTVGGGHFATLEQYMFTKR